MRKCPVCANTVKYEQVDNLLICAVCSAFIGEAPMNIDKMRIRAVDRLVQLGWVFKDNEWINPMQGSQDCSPTIPSGANSVVKTNPYELAFRQAYRVLEDEAKQKPTSTVNYLALHQWIDAIKYKFGITL